jgi:hypothetical protein
MEMAKSRRTWPIMLRVVRELEQRGRTDMFDYLTAFFAARTYLGGKLEGPWGERGFNVRLVAICIAARAMRDELKTVA